MSEVVERPFDKLRVADVFCGAGGLSEGFRLARRPDGSRAYEVVFAVDRDPDCVATFRANVLAGPRTLRERRAVCRSVVGLSGAEVLEAAGVDAIDVLVGGPNCQAVSTAGRRNLDDERNGMFEEFVRLVEELQPRWFVMENVPGLTHSNALPLLGEIFERFRKLDGYDVAGDVLLAANFGVAQYRHRLFLVGTRTGLGVRLPQPSHHADRRPRHRTVADAIGPSALPLVAVASGADEDLNVRRVRHVPRGGDWRDIPVELLPDRSFAVRTSDQKGAYGRLAWDRPAFTITGLASNVTAGPFTHPDEHRALTVREAASLQGFRPSYRFAGSTRSQYRQVGNAVPPRLAKALAEGIVAIEDGHGDDLVIPRLTREVVDAAVSGRRRLPVMTPRVSTRTSAKPTARLASHTEGRDAPSVDGPLPDPSTRPDPLAVLRAEAALPKYSWTAKRARAILGLLDGRRLEELAEELKISTLAAQRWHDEFQSAGVEGWRAYHTPVDALAAGDAELAGAIASAIEEVRRHTLVADVREGRARSHMNTRLRRLIRRFEGESVNAIMAQLAAAGRPVGTMYVGDLLAVADVLLTLGDEHVGRQAEAAGPVAR